MTPDAPLFYSTKAVTGFVRKGELGAGKVAFSTGARNLMSLFERFHRIPHKALPK